MFRSFSQAQQAQAQQASFTRPARLLVCLLALLPLLSPPAGAAGTPAGARVSNVATFESEDGAVRSNPVEVTIAAVCAAELSAGQAAHSGQLGEDALLGFSLKNLGNAAFDFPVTAAAPSDFRGRLTLAVDRNGNGQVDAGETLSGDLTLAADESAALLLLVQGAGGGQSRFGLRSGCADAPLSAESTLDTAARSLKVAKSVTGDAQVQAGDPVTYDLSVTNPNAGAVTNVTLADALPAGLNFVSATPAPGTQDGQKLSWTFVRLEAGETRHVSLTARVAPETPDDALIENVASATSGDTPEPVSSAPAPVRVFSSGLLLSKSAESREYEAGDTVAYTVKVVNPSQSAGVRRVVVTDQPDSNLSYQAGSATLNGAPTSDPQSAPEGLLFQIGDLAPGGGAVLRYRMRLLAGASGRLDNRVSAQGFGVNGRQVASVTSNPADAAVQVRRVTLNGRADVLGRVYVDNDGDGTYTADRDLPVAGARVLLGGVGEVLSDAQGRYHFENLTPGRYPVSLDGRSVVWAPEARPGNLGVGGALLVSAYGLTPADFPLLPNQGEAKVSFTAVGGGLDARLTYKLPAHAKEGLLALRLPAGAGYRAGSAQLNGTPLPDPAVLADGRLAWTLENWTLEKLSGELRFNLDGDTVPTAPAPVDLAARYAGGREEALQGRVRFADLPAPTPTVTEREAPIRFPLPGGVISGRGSSNVVVQLPRGADQTLTVNGVPVPARQIGKRGSDPVSGLTRLEFVAVPLRTGENVLRAGGDEVRVLVSGPAALAVVRGENLTADGVSVPTLRFEVRDAAGLRAELPSLSVLIEGGAEAQEADADPNQAGFQVALREGVGTLKLRPLTGARRVTLRLSVNGHAQTEVLNIAAGQHGALSATGSLTLSGAGAILDGRGTLETPLGAGQLTAVADARGVHDDSTPLTRYPAYGDASAPRRPLTADGPLAARFEAPDFAAEYARGAAQDPVFGTPPSGDALYAETRGNVRLGGYLAPQAGGERLDRFVPDGTRVLRLSQVPRANTERLHLVFSLNGAEVRRTELRRDRDYVLDPETGVITLAASLVATTPEGLNVLLEARYQVLGGSGGLAFGAHLSADVLGGTLSAGAVSENGQVAVGVRVAGRQGPLSGTAVVAVAGGLRAEGALNYQGAVNATATAHSEGAGYAGPGGSGAGSGAAVSVSVPLGTVLGNALSASGSAELHAGETAGESATVGLAYQGAPFKLAAGLSAYGGDRTGLGLNLAGSYDGGPLQVNLALGHDLTRGYTGATLGLAYRLSEQFALGLSNTLTLGGDVPTNRTALTLGGTLADGLSYSAQYELPGASGDNGRARFGVDARRPLNDRLSLGLRANVDAGLASASLDLAYKETNAVLTLGADAAQVAGGWKADLRSGATFSPTWGALSFDGLSEVTPIGAGHRYGFGLAVRADDWSLLGYARARTGTLAPQGEGDLSAELNAVRSLRNWDLRGGLAAKVSGGDPGSLTLAGSAGGRLWLNDSLGVGAALRGVYQPVGGTFAGALGLEATLVPVKGFGLTLGYNFGGFGGFTAEPTQPGVYLRLDLLLGGTGFGGGK